MPIPSSGAISMSMFNTEFGLGNSFSAYRGKGSVPASGPISFSQLYGASNVIREPTSGEYYDQYKEPYSFWSVNTQELAGTISITFNGFTFSNGGKLIFPMGTPTQTSIVFEGKTYYRGTLKQGSNNTYGAVYAIYRTTP